MAHIGVAAGNRVERGERMGVPFVAVVDEVPEILTLMDEILGDEGYRVVTGTNADDIEGILVRERPGLLILDVRLPGAVTGLPLLRTIRDYPATAHLPILVATADLNFLRENAGALKDLGCETLAKPFDIDAFLGCVGTLIPAHDRTEVA